jgi:uronate dehydrogenase
MTGRHGSKPILITGAAGYLGSVLRRALRGEHVLRLSDRRRPDDLGQDEEFVAADLASMTDVATIMDNVDTVVHLGGCSLEAPWDEILQANIVGTYNVFEAARRAGVRRVIYASSHHVVGFYRRDQLVDTQMPPRPDSRYAVSKVFGEAIGRLYADKHGLSVVCQRIGVARPKPPPNDRGVRTWLSEDDYVQLTRQCLQASDIRFLIVYGVSANPRPFWDNKTDAAIGYRPESNAELCLQEPLARPEDEPEIERLFQGGWFCGMEFGNDPGKID